MLPTLLAAALVATAVPPATTDAPDPEQMNTSGETTDPHATSEEHGDAHLSSGYHPPFQRTIVAARGLACFDCVEGSDEPLVGAGAFIEYAVVPHRLNVELSVSGVGQLDYFEVPVEALLKFPIALGQVVEVSPGIGGMMVDLPLEERWLPGAIANVDVFFWNRSNVAVFVEADGVMHMEHGHPQFMTEYGTGIAYRF